MEQQSYERPFLQQWGLYGLIVTAGTVEILSPVDVGLFHRARMARNSIHESGAAFDESKAIEVSDPVLMLMGRSAQMREVQKIGVYCTP